MSNYKLPSSEDIEDYSKSEIFDLAKEFYTQLPQVLKDMDKQKLVQVLWNNRLRVLDSKTILESLEGDKLSTARLIGSVAYIHNSWVDEEEVY